ncbi:DUF3159 domain-containing protein [Desulfovibrio mangrovi]|uniref:DUF3159 domain-containing protein n=1 Tax=Desulfovibrio mangrovi TaxID=2976983 RepID=UPI002247A080|nr:DUF3159 domain-containing protein [Desulfovibrio mangrovi]UZP68289.1 DUF3159 domain-containing protein [Desulfovibrio mangrovi]
MVGKAQLVRMLTGLGIPFGVYGIMSGIGFPFEGLMWATAVCFCILGWRVVADNRLDGFSGVASLLVLVEFAALFSERHELTGKTPALYALLLGAGLLVFALLRIPLFQGLAEDLLQESFFPERLRQSPYYNRGWRLVNLGWAFLFLLKGAILFSSYGTMPDNSLAGVHLIMGWPLFVFMMILSIWFIRIYWNRKALWAS